MTVSLDLGRRVLGGAMVATLLTLLWLQSPAVRAQQKERAVNLYSSRHYSSDQELYDTFTRQTGIKVNQIQAGDEALLERLKSEGKASPADVILLADAARLWKAQNEGCFSLPTPRS